MKKIMSTLLVSGVVILLTASFGFAEFTATGVSSFPYFQFGCLIVGGLIIITLKHKYEKMYTGEAAGAFALYAVFVAMFTSPVIDMIRLMIS
jgi:FtsH-binding integral membrane protein